jgi:hypothetical protein
MMPAAGVSWRVGVVQPLDPNLDLEALGEIGRSMVAASQEVGMSQASGPDLIGGVRVLPLVVFLAQQGYDVHVMTTHSKTQHNAQTAVFARVQCSTG